jgi:F-type H+-transporting ATPase subunit epsilon
MALIKCNIVSAQNEIFSGDIEMLVATGALGDVGVAHGHAPLLTQLAPGPVRIISEGGEEDVYFLSGGMLEVQPDVITVLSDTAVRAEDIDEAAALEAQEKARHELSDQHSEIDYGAATAQLAEAAARLRTLQAIRKKMGG